MLTELQDTDAKIFHDVFQAWRQENENNRFLTLETKGRANLHGVACQHLGDAEWMVDAETGKHSLTRKRKIHGNGLEASLRGREAMGLQYAFAHTAFETNLLMKTT